MLSEARFLFLGTGASMGIPVVGCHCPVCRSESPCNQRMRPSGLIMLKNGKKILIDCGPDYRWQALKYHIDSLDGLILTHAHHDHTAGLDELRVYAMRSKKPIPCLLSIDTADDIRHRYQYMFEDTTLTYKLTSRLSLKILESVRGEVQFEDMRIQYVTYEQGGMAVNGFRFGNFAYISDIKHYPETIFGDLQGVEILVISALRYESSAFHLGIPETIEFSKKVGASHTWLTHIAHELDHEAANASLPANVRMAYDGLELNFMADLV